MTKKSKYPRVTLKDGRELTTLAEWVLHHPNTSVAKSFARVKPKRTGEWFVFDWAFYDAKALQRVILHHSRFGIIDRHGMEHMLFSAYDENDKPGHTSEGRATAPRDFCVVLLISPMAAYMEAGDKVAMEREAEARMGEAVAMIEEVLCPTPVDKSKLN